MDQEQNTHTHPHTHTHTHTLLSEVSRTTAVLLASGSRVNGGVCSTLVCKGVAVLSSVGGSCPINSKRRSLFAGQKLSDSTTI